MPPVKIAIIGSGIAGLAAAYWLNQEHDVRVTLLERTAELGMDSRRVDLQDVGQSVAVDVPSRMFNATQWPNLIRLYDEIGVQYEAVDASQSFTKRCTSSGVARDETYLEMDVAFRPDRALRQMLKSQPRAILAEATRLMSEGRRDLDSGINRAQTLGEYLAVNKYATSFKTEFLYPTLSSTVCTCSYSSLDKYPAHIMLAALRCLSDDRALLRTRHGTRDVVRRLSAGLDDVRTNHEVKCIVDDGDQVTVTTADGAAEKFDHVIVATQANTALSLQPDIPYFEREVLAFIPYHDVHVVVHRDESLMPSRRSAWRTFNMMVCESESDDTIDAAMCTVWLNRFDTRCRTFANVFQTIGPVVEPAASAVVARIRLQRPAVNAQSLHGLATLEDLHELQDRRIWYCGSWSVAGVPLLETAVVSAQRVAECVLQSRNAPC